MGDQFRYDSLYDVHRDGESYARIDPAEAAYGSVDANYAALGIKEGPSGITRVDSSISLDHLGQLKETLEQAVDVRGS